MTPDVDAVSRIIEDAARTLVLPRFTRLAEADIQSKSSAADPDDIVTIVDQEVEAYLTRAFLALTPGAAVLGEESVYGQPDGDVRVALDRSVWVIDPIDGTKNFASGDTAFGTMVAWVVNGHARAAWTLLPARGQLFVAEAGSGTFLNGNRMRVPGARGHAKPRGTVLVRYMPGGVGARVTTALAGRIDEVSSAGCAAVEYTDVLKGERDFAVYHRLLPWDHAAPALILTEAGGRVLHATGEDYTAASSDQVTVVARDPSTARELCGWLGPACADDRDSNP